MVGHLSLLLGPQDFHTSLAPRQRDKDTGREPTLLRRLQLAADEIQCVLPVDRQHVVGKPRYVHDQASLTSSHSNARRTALFCTSAKADRDQRTRSAPGASLMRGHAN